MGADVAGRMEPLATGRAIMGDATRFPSRPMLWPLLIGAWKRKERA